MNMKSTAKALGWFSIGLGATELLAPGWLQKQLGVKGHSTLTRAFGMREMMAGAGILGRQNKAPWMWSRVAGDALDIATLGAAFRSSSRRGRLAMAVAAVAAVTLVDAIVASRLPGRQDGADNAPADSDAGPAAPARQDEAA